MLMSNWRVKSKVLANSLFNKVAMYIKSLAENVTGVLSTSINLFITDTGGTGLQSLSSLC